MGKKLKGLKSVLKGPEATLKSPQKISEIKKKIFFFTFFSLNFLGAQKWVFRVPRTISDYFRIFLNFHIFYIWGEGGHQILYQDFYVCRPIELWSTCFGQFDTFFYLSQHLICISASNSASLLQSTYKQTSLKKSEVHIFIVIGIVTSL